MDGFSRRDRSQAGRSRVLARRLTFRCGNAHRLQDFGVDVISQPIEGLRTVRDEQDVRLALQDGASRRGPQLVAVLLHDRVGLEVPEPEKLRRQNLIPIPGRSGRAERRPRFRPNEYELVTAPRQNQSVEAERVEARRVRLVAHRVRRQRHRNFPAHSAGARPRAGEAFHTGPSIPERR